MESIRYRKPGYVALTVSDVARSVRYYRDVVGLALSEPATDEVAFLHCSEDHHNVVLHRGDAPGIRRMAFEMESPRDLDIARSRMTALGWFVEDVADVESRRLKQGPTLRFRIPEHRLLFEFYVGMDPAATPFVPTVAKIERLGHVVIRCRQRDAVLRALTEVLNFKVSDHFGESTTFLRCFPNPYHHSFGVAEGADDGLHHVNFMVSDIDDVGRSLNRLKKNDVEVVFGPGRHDISNSVFLYYLDPDRLTVEYSFGMEEFAEVDARAPRDLPPEAEILDAWGGLPTSGFGRVGAVLEAD